MRKSIDRMELVHDFLKRTFSGSLHAADELAHGRVSASRVSSPARSILPWAKRRAASPRWTCSRDSPPPPGPPGPPGTSRAPCPSIPNQYGKMFGKEGRAFPDSHGPSAMASRSDGGSAGHIWLQSPRRMPRPFPIAKSGKRPPASAPGLLGGPDASHVRRAFPSKGSLKHSPGTRPPRPHRPERVLPGSVE